tara:strand:- start:3843 stop:5990 length:2148 start_codon:yes stop_codon:yes gene_type:complete
MASWKKVVVSGSAISQLSNDLNYISAAGQNILSSSAQIATDISGSFVSASSALNTRIDNITSTITLSADTGTNDTYTTGETLTFSGGNGIDTVVTDNNIAINGVAGLVSGSGQIAALVEAASDSNTFTDADHSKLNAIEASADVTDATNVTAAGALMDSEVTDLAGIKGVTISTLQVKPSEGAFANGDKTKLDAIEASATADQTDAEIRTAVEAATDSNVFTDADHSKLNAIEASADVTDATNVTAAGALMDSELTSIADVKALNQSLVTGASPTFVGLTLTGNLEVQGTTTTIDSTTIELGDNILAVNGTGAVLGGLHVNDANGPASGSILWDGANNRWIAGASGSEKILAVLDGQGLISSSAQISGDISGSFVLTSASLAADIATNAASIASSTNTITLSADSGTNDTYTTGETLTFAGGNGITTVVTDNNIAVNGVAGLISASAQITYADIPSIPAVGDGGLTTNDFTNADHSKLNAIEASATADQTDAEIRAAVEAATDSNVFTDTDHSKLNAIEASATADQTDAEIRTAVEAAGDSNVFTDADHSKLNAIEASADVTDATNVTAAGALMDSELTNLAAVKAINQSLVTGASPTFVGLTLTGDLTVTGTTTNINSADLNIEDKFILLNSGSATGNSGIIAQNSATSGVGTSLFFDDTANRWSLDYAGANANTDVVTADARIAAVALSNSDANYQKDGNIFVDSGDVFIYVE